MQMGILKWLFGAKSGKKTTPSDETALATPTQPQLNDIESLAQKAWEAYDACAADYVLKPSIPMLFFGNGSAYRKSAQRIITVGKNPSPEEFPEDDRFMRFPKGRESVDGTRDCFFYDH